MLPFSPWVVFGVSSACFGNNRSVYSTGVGYSGGYTPNPTYHEVCSGRTAHAEVVRVVFDPAIISYKQLLQIFWENHDPAQGMRQGVISAHNIVQRFTF